VAGPDRASAGAFMGFLDVTIVNIAAVAS